MIRATRAFFVADGHTVIYGDTDSVMVDLLQAHEHEYGDMTDAKTVKAEDLRALDRLIAICVDYSRKISATFTRPNVLNFEKIAPVFLLIAKKTYAAIVWEYKSPKAGAPEQAIIKGIDFKGVSCVRRDWCPFSRRLGEKMLNMVLKRRSLDDILSAFQEHVDMMVDDKVPLKDYLLTKKLKALYGTKPPIHKEVALKMAERDPELAPPVGTRIQYVVCNNGETEFSKQGEEFDHALKTNMKPDLNYYFDKQLLKPILRTLVTVDTNIENLLMQTADHRLRAKMSPKKDVFAHFVRPKSIATSSSAPSPTSPTASDASKRASTASNVPNVHAPTPKNGADGSIRDVVAQGRKTSATNLASAAAPEMRAICPKPQHQNSSRHQQQQQQQPQQQQSASAVVAATTKNGAPLSLRALFQQNRSVAVANAKRAVSQPPSANKIVTGSNVNAVANAKRAVSQPPSTNKIAIGSNVNAGANASKPTDGQRLRNTQGLQAQTTNGAVATQRTCKPRFATSALASPADVHPFFAGF
jgi:hypothetical protein